MMKRRFSNGFTIVELLVVIAIIAMLVGLLLPAVNRARATARQTQCINNQKQLGTAVQTYFTSKGRMPEYMSVARRESGKPVDAYGWIHPLLPNIGQANLHDQILDVVANGAPVASARLYIDLLVCPSDPQTSTEQPWLSYAPNAGRDTTERSNRARNSAPVDWPDNGVFGRSWPLSLSGIEQDPTKNSIEQISRLDGTTQTLLLSENSRLSTWNDVRHPILQAIWWTSRADPNAPLASVIPVSPAALDQMQLAGEVGSYWLPLLPPPSEPLTAIAYQGDLDLPKSDQANSGRPLSLRSTPSSKHSGGFIATFCDGHTQYINNQIEYNVFARLMSSNGRLARAPGVEVAELEDKNNDGNPDPQPPWQSTPISDTDFK